jgi:hypothetical protein
LVESDAEEIERERQGGGPKYLVYTTRENAENRVGHAALSFSPYSTTRRRTRGGLYSTQTERERERERGVSANNEKKNTPDRCNVDLQPGAVYNAITR